jgi:hypothetical protein
MNPNPKAKGATRVLVIVKLYEGLLDLHGALDCIHGAAELGQNTITCRIGDPATMLGNKPVHDLAMRCEDAESSNLILAHEPGISSHIRCEDRCQLSFNSLVAAHDGREYPHSRRITLQSIPIEAQEFFATRVCPYILGDPAPSLLLSLSTQKRLGRVRGANFSDHKYAQHIALWRAPMSGSE